MARALIVGFLVASTLLAADVEIGSPDFRNSLPFCGS